MNCETCEFRLCELLDQGVEPEEDAALAGHLAGCGECRAFATTWRDLDRTLAAQAEIDASVPDGFKARLFAILPEAAPRLLPAEIARLRRKLEAEHARRMAGLRWRFLVPPPATVLRVGAVVGGFIFAGIVVTELGQSGIVLGARALELTWAMRWATVAVSGCLGAVFLVRRTISEMLGLGRWLR